MLAVSPAGAAMPRFQAHVAPISPAAWGRMQGVAWTSGCPVGMKDLASLQLTFWGFDGSRIRARWSCIASLPRKRWRSSANCSPPISRLRGCSRTEAFDTGGYAQADDTVGFYCRPDQGDPSKFGMHSFGYAIDLNPRLNPYFDRKQGWWPPRLPANTDRDREAPGLITTRSAAFTIFTRHGWLWGGLFRDEPDYMHFEKATVGAHPNRADAPYQAQALRYVQRPDKSARSQER